MNLDSIRVVLVSPRNPLNIGAAARAMSNFGFLHMRLVNAYDVAYHEAKSAVKASAVLDASAQFSTVAEAVADCSLVIGTTSLGHRELKHALRRLEHAGEQVRTASREGNVAVLFGSEKFGLGNDDISHCHWLVRIPTREVHESMNLGQAVAVVLYELIRSDEAADPDPNPFKPAESGHVERIAQMLLTALKQSGYVHDQREDGSELMVRRLLHRHRLSERDAQMWMGMLRQILWKLHRS